MTNKPVGGRGHKAPYQSRTVRVPEPIIEQVEQLCNLYREAVTSGTNETIEGKELSLSITPIARLDKNEAIDEAQKIIKGKKSARLSLEKLLQLLYSDKNIKL